MLRRRLSQLRALWHWKQRQAELDEELRFHLDTEVEERQELGLRDDEARRAARLDFGNVAVIAEDTRAAWGWTTGEQVLHEIPYHLRRLSTSRASTAAAVLCLALGIGANTLLYGLTDAILLRQLPVNDPKSLVRM